jgi:hypothetical protein
MATQTFPLADILSVTTEKLLSRRHMDGIYEILNFMTGQDVFTHQLGDACDKAKPALLQQHPNLADVRPPDGLDQHDLMAWLVETERVHGEALEITSLSDWEYRDPIEDACDPDLVCADLVARVPLPSQD